MLVTLTTDFGDGSSYVAAMKGALLSVNPEARIVDLTHRIPPQDLAAAGWFLSETLRWFPAGTIHVVVIDPGVGSDRSMLCIEWNRSIILVPDNGCWTPIVQPGDGPIRVRKLEDRKYWRQDVTATFHGRDILAPVAGHLSLGGSPADLGPTVNQWISLALPQPEMLGDSVVGQIVLVDHFGNLLTNIPASAIPCDGLVQVGDSPAICRVRTYSDSEPGNVVALIGSSGRLEIAVVNGSAARRLGQGVGAIVRVSRG